MILTSFGIAGFRTSFSVSEKDATLVYLTDVRPKIERAADSTWIRSWSFTKKPERIDPLRFASKFLQAMPDNPSKSFEPSSRRIASRHHRPRNEFTSPDDPIAPRPRAMTLRPVDVAETGCVNGGVNPPLWLGNWFAGGAGRTIPFENA